MSTFHMRSHAGFPPVTIGRSPYHQLSDELRTALDEGQWWAIVEVEYPISEEPEYGDPATWPWWEIMETEGSWSSSLVSNDASKESKKSVSSDATMNRTDQLRQRSKMPSVPARSETGHLSTSSLALRVTSEKAESLCSRFSDVKHQKPWNHKKPRQVAESAGSQHRAPVSAGSSSRGKLRIPEHLRQHLQKAAFALEIPLRIAPMAVKPLQEAPKPDPKVLACAAHGVDKIPEGKEVKIPESLRQKVLELKQSPQDSSSKGIPDKIPEKKRLKIREPLRTELLQLHQRTKPSSIKEAHVTSAQRQLVPAKNPELQKQRVLEVQQRPRDFSLNGAPVSSSQGSGVPDKIPVRKRLKICEPLRTELLQLHQGSKDCSQNGSAVTSAKRQTAKIPEPLGQEVQQDKPQATSFQGSPKAAKTPEKASTEPAVPTPLPVSINQTAPEPFRTPHREPVFTLSCALTTGSLQLDTKCSGVLKEQRQKWREQLLRQQKKQTTQKPPQGAPVPYQLPIIRALDSADVNHSAPVEKQCIKNKSWDKQSIDNLCNIFADLCL